MNRERLIFEPRRNTGRGFYVRAECHDVASDVWFAVPFRQLITLEGQAQTGLHRHFTDRSEWR